MSKQEMFLKLKPFIIEYTSHSLICIILLFGSIYIKNINRQAFIFGLVIFLPALLHFIYKATKVFTDLHKGDLVSKLFKLEFVYEVNFDILPKKKYYKILVTGDKRMSLISTDFPEDLGTDESIGICYFKRSKVIVNIKR